MNRYLYSGLENGPVVIERLLQRMPADRISQPTDPDRFSPQQVIAHLADWEPIYLDRMKQALTNQGTAVIEFDESEMVVRNRYDETDPLERARTYRELRAITLEWVRARSEGELEMWVQHSMWGQQSVFQIAQFLIFHDLYHIDQLTEVLTHSEVAA